MVPADVKYKRKWYVMKILGKGEKLLCERTNERAKRSLKRCRNEEYKKRWVNLDPGPVFSTVFGAFLGVAFLGVGSRHLMKKNPAWLSQYGENKLFGKITGNQYRLISAHFVAHSHTDSILFKKSVME